MNSALPRCAGVDVARYLPDVQDLWSLLEARATAHPDAPFVVWQPFDQPGRTLTYGAFAQRARRIAAGLQQRGAKPGDRVLIHLDNSEEFLLACFACAAAGAVAVTTNTRSALDELAYYAGDSGPVGAITQPRYVEDVARVAASARWLACTGNDGGIESGTGPGRADSFAALEGEADAYRRPALAALDPVIVQYTSGTTARPKGVVWTHANTLWAARINAGHERLTARDCHYTYLPLFHANAMTFSVLPTLWAGGRLVLTPKWSTSRFWEHSTRHGCTWASLIGLSIRSLLGMPAPVTHSYRRFGTGICADEFPGVGVKTIGWWGMTETVAPGIVGSHDAPNRYLSIGKAATQYEVAIVREDGSEVDPEETGHLRVRGVPGITLFAGYLNKPDATAAAFTDDGWFCSGDLVKPHDDGFVTFVDRHKDMLRVGAENVAASEVERVVASVAGITEAAVVGRADDKLDEVPVVFVTVAPDVAPGIEQQVIAECRRLLADFKVPRSVHVVNALPRSTLHKVNKVALRACAVPGADWRSAQRQWQRAARSDPSEDADLA